jgi:aminomethyltransferase
MVDFHGFELPIWYSSIQEEHLATRKLAGIFDVSHMGLFCFRGDEVRSWLSSVSTQEFNKFRPGSCGYTHFLDVNGYIIDDMIFAISSEDEVLGVPNSTMRERMLEWLEENLPEDGSIAIEDRSDAVSIIALQGPESPSIVRGVMGELNTPGRFACQRIMENVLGVKGWIQGTGYTGERGVEIFVEDEYAPLVWDAILSDSESRAVPVGLGARNTLRLEKGYLLSGQDFLWPGLGRKSYDLPEGFLARNTVETSVPYGLDLSHEFIGKEFVDASLEGGQRLRGLLCLDRGPSPRAGHEVFDGPGEEAGLLGHVTSGGPSPSLGMVGIALAYLDETKETEAWIQCSPKRRVRALLKSPPFV